MPSNQEPDISLASSFPSINSDAMSSFATPSSQGLHILSNLKGADIHNTSLDIMPINQYGDTPPSLDESDFENGISNSSSREQSPDTPPTPHEPQFDDFHDPNAVSVNQSESGSDSEDEECLDYGPSAPQELGDDSLLRMQALKQAVINSKIRDLAIQHNDHRKVETTKRGLATAYIDRDDSGNYDPKPQRTAHLKRKRPTTARRPNLETEGSAKGRRKWGLNRTRITFYFTNLTAIEYLKSISSQKFNATPSKELLGRKDSDSEEDKKHRLRPKSSLAVERDDGLTLDDLSDGHPQRRGCKVCFHLGDDGCSLIDCGDDWPCVQCEESGIDCQLILPPKLKLMCTLCKFKKKSCSYARNGGLGVERCTACEENDNICCAGPLDENSKFGKMFMNGKIAEPPQCALEDSSVSPSSGRYEDDSFSALKDRKPNENQKIEVGVAKSLTSESNEILKKGPLKGEISFQNANAIKPQKPKKLLASPSSRTSSPERHHANSKKQRTIDKLKPAKPRGRKRRSGLPFNIPLPFTDNIQHIKIKTCFAHPIALNHVPPADGSDPCSWCASPFFGIWGHGQTTVEVIPYGGNLGNIEVLGTGGHLEAGNPPSKMCLSCTFERCRIVKCKSHEVTKLEDTDGESFNAGKFAESMMALRAGDIDVGIIGLQTKWCSICASPAAFSCSRSQPFSADGIVNLRPGQPTTDPAFKGCSLHLCTVCNRTLQRIKSSQSVDKRRIVESLIEVRTRELWKHEGDEIRADSNFLMTGGELTVRLKEIANGKGKGSA